MPTTWVLPTSLHLLPASTQSIPAASPGFHGCMRAKLQLRKETRTPVFFTALFTIVKIWKQPKCPPTDEWKKMWYVWTVGYYSAITKNEMPFAATWVDPDIVILSEVSQMEKDETHMILLICGEREWIGRRVPGTAGWGNEEMLVKGRYKHFSLLRWIGSGSNVQHGIVNRTVFFTWMLLWE